jgi:hypothetical protein
MSHKNMDTHTKYESFKAKNTRVKAKEFNVKSKSCNFSKNL